MLVVYYCVLFLRCKDYELCGDALYISSMSEVISLTYKKTNDQNLAASSYVECSTLREFDSEYGTFCFVIVSMMVSLSFG